MNKPSKKQQKLDDEAYARVKKSINETIKEHIPDLVEIEPSDTREKIPPYPPNSPSYEQEMSN